MSTVKVLSPDVVSKIAAGEVIERPSSVVKELVENALDAGATRIEILVKEAGRSLIHVKDNGYGISQGDIQNIFLRHATSKISNVDDLFHITSLGFRGEALYSIAAVSDIILRSKTQEQDSGFEIHIRGGNILDVKPVGMQTGTEVEIYELFFNTPARRKFLRKNTTEFNHILSTLIPYTLVFPSCSFMLTSDYKSSQRTVLHLLTEKNSINRIARALHVEKDHIIELHQVIPNRDVTMHAFLGDMNIRRTSKDLQFIFVNGRPVINRLLSYRLNEMYRLLFPSDIYPFFIKTI